jgi:hypothetical protein
MAALRMAHLFIDATADAEAFNALAGLASAEQKPMVWGEIFAGGLGGYVAYAIPGITPCPHCVRSAFIAGLDSFPPAPRGTTRPYGGADAGVPVTASDADVTVLAGLVTSVALRLLARDLEGYTPVTLVGFRRGWIFERSLDVRALSVRTDDAACSHCWVPMTIEDAEAGAAVAALLRIE